MIPESAEVRTCRRCHTAFVGPELCPATGNRQNCSAEVRSDQPAPSVEKALQRILDAYDNPTRYILAIEIEQARAALASSDPGSSGTGRFIPGRSCRHGINPDECEFCDGPGADKEEATRQAMKADPGGYRADPGSPDRGTNDHNALFEAQENYLEKRVDPGSPSDGGPYTEAGRQLHNDLASMMTGRPSHSNEWVRVIRQMIPLIEEQAHQLGMLRALSGSPSESEG